MIGGVMLWSLFSHLVSRFFGFALFVTLANWLLIAIGAAIVYLLQMEPESPKTFRGFICFCLPPEIIKTQTSRVDAVLFVLSALYIPFLVTPFIVGSIFCSTVSYHGLTVLFGARAQLSEPMVVWVLAAVVVTVAADFATFYTHYLDHRIPVMWEFHKVHHSSEFLTPMTNKRFHPVEKVFNDTGVTVVAGGLLGFISYVFSVPIYENTIIGVDAYFLLNTLSFFHLRHSHISLSYGRLERWLLSPAQHQLHHSREGRHWDKNFGLFFSVWDRWFGTLVYSEPRESFRLGLAGNEAEKYRSVLQIYTTPFINIGKMAGSILRNPARQRGSAGTLPQMMHAQFGVASEPGGVKDAAVVIVPADV
jgi:sterol desaturase/sphingolipid hydroxylase (fatty acid hydroxylase superfamily)